MIEKKIKMYLDFECTYRKFDFSKAMSSENDN